MTRPARVPREVAERLMADARARGQHPKPLPVLRPRKPIKRGKAPKLATKRIAPMSARTRRRVTGWAGFRESIRARDGAVCGWCGLPEERRGGTAEHAYPRVHSRADAETNCYWIGSWDCHRAKESSGVQGQIRMLRALAERYRAKLSILAEDGLIVERNLLVLALAHVQRDIEAKKRPSLLR